MARAASSDLSKGNSVMEPVGVIRPMRLAVVLLSVNHRLPSGPWTMSSGLLCGCGSKYSVMPTANRQRSSSVSTVGRADGGVDFAERRQVCNMVDLHGRWMEGPS